MISKRLKVYLARQYARIYPASLFIGVTGSVGKTTCVEMARVILSQKYKTLTTGGSDGKKDIPTTLLNINPSIKKVILEMGITNIGDMDFHLSQVKPQTVIFTKISYDNSEYLGGLDDIIQEKSKLIKHLGKDSILILNYDDPVCKKLAKDCLGSIFYFGTDPQNCTVWAGNIRVEDYKTTFELNLGVERVKVNLPLLGPHQVYSALAAASLGVVCEVPLTKIKLALESLKTIEHQMQPVSGPNGSIIIDDTINSSPAALESAIDTLLQINARRRILVLGEMKNLGEYSDSLHCQIAQRIFKEKIDLVYLGVGDAQIIATELRSLGFWEERLMSNLHSSQIVTQLLKNLRKGDVVLIKGAHSVRLDEVVKRIARKN